MYQRKIESLLQQWKNQQKHKPLVIKGVRQCGKTSSVLEFAQKNYEQVIYLNFHEKKTYKAFFAGDLDVETLTTNIALGIIGTQFVPFFRICNSEVVNMSICNAGMIPT